MSSKHTDKNGVPKRVRCHGCLLRSNPVETRDIPVAEWDCGSHLEGDHGWGAHHLVNNSQAPPGSVAEYYSRFGFYWNYFPKTDYTYSPHSPYYKKEVAPGIPVIPNLSRRPLRRHLGCKSKFNGPYLSSSEDESKSTPKLNSSLPLERRLSTVSQVLKEALRVVVSTVTKTITTVVEVTTHSTGTTVTAIAGSGSNGSGNMRTSRVTFANNAGARDFGLWSSEVMASSTPVGRQTRRRSEQAEVVTSNSRSFRSPCHPLLFLSLLLASAAILLSSVFLFPPQLQCHQESSEVAGSLWRFPDGWSLPTWPGYLSLWYTPWFAWLSWPSWTSSNPAPYPDNSKTELSALMRDVRDEMSSLKKRIIGLEDHMSGLDQLTAVQIRTIKHQLSELKSQSEKAAQSARTQSNSISEVLNVKDLAAYVDSAISKFLADRISIPDYALQSSGGEVVSIRCTVTHKTSSAYYTLLGIPLAAKTISPDVALTPSTMPGDCWPFEGQTGSLVVRLSRKIKVTGFTIDHAPKEILPRGNFASAPKDFSVYGLTDINDKASVLLGQFRFEEDGGSVQHFKAVEVDIPYQLVELAIHSNHGHMLYTCLYRFRVHGIPVDPEDWLAYAGPSL